MMAEIDIDKVVAETIIIYTERRPNPKSGKWDCNITKREKEQFRLIMKKKLQAAKTEQELQAVIDHYKRLFSE